MLPLLVAVLAMAMLLLLLMMLMVAALLVLVLVMLVVVVVARLPLRRRHDVLLLEQVVKPAAEGRQQLPSLLHQERPAPKPSVNNIAREA